MLGGNVDWKFILGKSEKLRVESAMELLEGLEALVDWCVERGEVFAIIEHGSEFCQLLLDADDDLHIETSLGDLAEHAGFDESVPEFAFLKANRLPASWHARAKMTADAMTRAFIDAGKMTFPADLDVQVHPAIVETASDDTPPPHTEGAPTIGFCFGEDRPVHTFVDEISPVLGIEAETIGEIRDALQQLLEVLHGPLNRIEDWQSADIIVELGSKGPAGDPWTVRLSGLAGEVDGAAVPIPEVGETQAAELVIPSEDLEQADVIDVDIVPIVMFGLFNPAGPTVVAVTALRNSTSGVSNLVVTMLNPFSQSRKIVARAGTDDESISGILPELARHVDAPFLTEAPSLVVLGSAVMTSDQLGSGAMDLVNLLVSSGPGRPLEELVASYRAHLGDPWKRIGMPGQLPAELKVEQLDDPYAAWLEIMMDAAHAEPELAAIVNAWGASIEHFGTGLPHMSVTEAGRELWFLGLPFLPTEDS